MKEISVTYENNLVEKEVTEGSLNMWQDYH